MSDPVFYLIAYALPLVLSVTMGIALALRAVQMSSTVRAVVCLLSWSVLSACNCLLAAFVGRLYTYVRTHDAPSDPMLPLRPGLIILGLLLAQGAVGAILFWVLARGRDGRARGHRPSTSRSSV
jgi:hypothetical protein